MFKQLITESVGDLLQGHDTSKVALSLSGGTDSSILLFTLLSFGIKPSLYTYYLEDSPSEDLKIARLLANHYGLNLTECKISSSVEQLQRDTLRLVNEFKIKGKVCIQCCHGHMYVAPLVKEPIIFNGSGIDGISGSYKEYFLSDARKNKMKFDILRQVHLDNPNDDAMQDQTRIYGKYGSKVLYPYRNAGVVDFIMSKSWEEINTPRWKNLMIQGFGEFDSLKIYRPRGSQQIMAGTREFHDNLLKTSLNVKGRKRVQELYKDISKSF